MWAEGTGRTGFTAGVVAIVIHLQDDDGMGMMWSASRLS